MNASRLAATATLLVIALLQACGGGGGSGIDETDDVGGNGAGPPPVVLPPDPPLRSSPADLDDALNCTAFVNTDKPPVLLVHGTTVTGTDQFTG